MYCFKSIKTVGWILKKNHATGIFNLNEFELNQLTALVKLYNLGFRFNLIGWKKNLKNPHFLVVGLVFIWSDFRARSAFTLQTGATGEIIIN